VLHFAVLNRFKLSLDHIHDKYGNKRILWVGFFWSLAIIAIIVAVNLPFLLSEDIPDKPPSSYKPSF